MALTKEQRVKVEMVIEHHDHWQKSYFWSAKGTNATSRRRTENKESFEVSFKHHGVVYRYVSSVRVSSSNYYYRGEFFEDGVKKNVALFKRLLKTPKKDRKRALTAKQIESFTTKDLMRIMDQHKDKLMIYDGLRNGNECYTPDIAFFCLNGDTVQINTVNSDDDFSDLRERKRRSSAGHKAHKAFADLIELNVLSEERGDDLNQPTRRRRSTVA